MKEDAELQAVEALARRNAEAYAATEEGAKYLKGIAEQTAEKIVVANRETRAAEGLGQDAQRKTGALERRYVQREKASGGFLLLYHSQSHSGQLANLPSLPPSLPLFFIRS